MKKMLLIFAVVLLIFIACDKSEPIPGFVGKPVYLAPVVESLEDTLACTYEWNFNDKPEGSNMDILSFQPNSRSFNISFVPDVPGDYVVAYSIFNPAGKLKAEKELVCRIIEDTTTVAETKKEEGYPLSEEALNAPAPVYVEAEAAPQSKSTDYQPTPPKAAPPKKTSRPAGQNIPTIPGKYTIQISAWKTYAGAERAVRLLAPLELDLYIQKAVFEETGEVWYRVRTGNFDSRSAAKVALKNLKRKLPHEKLWIDVVRQDQ